MTERIRCVRGIRPHFGVRRLRGAAGYAYLAYFLLLPVLLLVGPWIVVATLGTSLSAALKTTAGVVGGAYLVGLGALLR